MKCERCNEIAKYLKEIYKSQVKYLDSPVGKEIGYHPYLHISQTKVNIAWLFAKIKKQPIHPEADGYDCHGAFGYEKENKEKDPETFDFSEAMRRMEKGKMVETEAYLYKLDKNGCVYQSIKGILNSWSIYPCHLSKHYLDKMYSEYKEQPKTFGWDEAYKFIRIGKSVAQLGWSNKTQRIFYTLGSKNFTRKEKVAGVWIENDCAITAAAMKATDWYVYEE